MIVCKLFPLRFRGYFEEDSSNPGQYDFTMAFWHILAAKLAFVVIFEVLVKTQSYFYESLIKFVNFVIACLQLNACEKVEENFFHEANNFISNDLLIIVYRLFAWRK